MSQKARREIPVFGYPIIETHCHLDYLDEQDLPLALERAREVGVERIITIAVSPGNLDRVLALTRCSPVIWGTQGVHPHEAASFDEGTAEAVRNGLADPRILAVGEIGLDYFYEHTDRPTQRRVFERQLQLAVEADLPVVIHTRDADDDCRAILGNCSAQLTRKGVIHSFTSSLSLAEFCLGEGFMLGFNGITTFNRADNVREVVAATPLNRLVLETDAPYLTPVPYRGKPNAPCYLPFIAEKIAEVKRCALPELLQQTHANSLALFFGRAA